MWRMLGRQMDTMCLEWCVARGEHSCEITFATFVGSGNVGVFWMGNQILVECDNMSVVQILAANTTQTPL